jgi:hypothetical protein
MSHFLTSVTSPVPSDLDARFLYQMPGIGVEYNNHALSAAIGVQDGMDDASFLGTAIGIDAY